MQTALRYEARNLSDAELQAITEALTEMGATELQIRVAKQICRQSGLRKAILVAESWPGISKHEIIRAISPDMTEPEAQPELPWWVE